MNPLVLPKRPIQVDFNGTVWWCSKCEYTSPRFENDQLKKVFHGGIKCGGCGMEMVVKKGEKVSSEYLTSKSDSV